jgi:molybdopterin/thiamine biosynthesis adenylyltransferase
MFSERELERYNRQMMLFGEDGQERLKKAHIFIAGAGGLGSPVSIYLAVAGVGTITIVDMDVIDGTNLNRQILHYERDIGRKKTASAEEKLREQNPDIIINAVNVKIDESNAKNLVGKADGIVDGMDNYPTRYLLNDVAIVKKIPFFHGGIRGFYGQATTIIPGTTPCLKCIFPKSPPREEFPVVGVTAGIIGTVQSNEVIKYLTGTGDLLTNRLFLWDGMQAHAEEISIERNPSCEACGGRGKKKKAGMKK